MPDMKEETLLAKLNLIKDANFSLRGYLDRPLGLGLNAGNTFIIVARDLTEQEVDTCQRNAHFPGKDTNHEENKVHIQSIPNYFDEQRVKKNNVAIGRALVKHDYVRASQIINEHDNPVQNPIKTLRAIPKKTCLLYIHAYQSWLFNETVKRILQDVPHRTVPYGCGEFFFPDDKIKNAEIPLIGFAYEKTACDSTGTTYDNTAYDNIIQQLLKEEGIVPRDFIIREIPELTSEGAMRPLLIDVEEFSLRIEDDDHFLGKKKATLAFTLPSGSYATIVVKALFAEEKS